MNATDASAVIDLLGADAFFTVGYRDQTWCLIQDGVEWCVFFADRGERSAEHRFASEDAAARELLLRLVKNPDVRPARRSEPEWD